MMPIDVKLMTKLVCLDEHHIYNILFWYYLIWMRAIYYVYIEVVGFNVYKYTIRWESQKKQQQRWLSFPLVC